MSLDASLTAPKRARVVEAGPSTSSCASCRKGGLRCDLIPDAAIAECLDLYQTHCEHRTLVGDFIGCDTSYYASEEWEVLARKALNAIKDHWVPPGSTPLPRAASVEQPAKPATTVSPTIGMNALEARMLSRSIDKLANHVEKLHEVYASGLPHLRTITARSCEIEIHASATYKMLKPIAEIVMERARVSANDVFAPVADDNLAAADAEVSAALKRTLAEAELGTPPAPPPVNKRARVSVVKKGAPGTPSLPAVGSSGLRAAASAFDLDEDEDAQPTPTPAARRSALALAATSTPTRGKRASSAAAMVSTPFSKMFNLARRGVVLGLEALDSLPERERAGYAQGADLFKALMEQEAQIIEDDEE
ncbi:hypothetical protein CDD80_5130 [Ophiocordyceps camponoti-rufipedis]|uniref:Uncharacterized protein n=1 Tax=Ophiocordyceps camponoti-rufipedis TaxID=2004952 RepID=A0A2C5YVC6_9HYPO|nr:hypothetical protein CDD80_5130 [Ophiocordyceps camponoti-rufipedis]